MSYKRPLRFDIIDRAFPVRLTLAVAPEQNMLVNRALTRTAGTGNYGVTPARLWSSQKAHHLHLYTVHDALMFLAACPQARLMSERYDGPPR